MINIFALTNTAYLVISKIATKDKGVDVMDLCLVRAMGLFLFAIPILKMSGKTVC